MSARRHAPEEPAIADAMRRIEDAFSEEPKAERAPSPEEIRAAEALLFAGGEVMTASALAQRLGEGVDAVVVLQQLKKDYEGRGVELVEVAGGWRFQTAPDLAGLFATIKHSPKKLPKAAMETLAVIAYHQPVTRAEIEDIRGVSLSRGALDLLLEIGWVKPRGRRRSPGRPLTFGTTDAFLAHFGLASLDVLPGKEELKDLGLLDSRAAAEIQVPRPGEGDSGDEEPLQPGDDSSSFFVDHLNDDG
ncbi:MAG: SMC-Scp complex subunit ScpB [Caulobacterales bacterium]